jgi:hypothetical protein
MSFSSLDFVLESIVIFHEICFCLSQPDIRKYQVHKQQTFMFHSSRPWKSGIKEPAWLVQWWSPAWAASHCVLAWLSLDSGAWSKSLHVCLLFLRTLTSSWGCPRLCPHLNLITTSKVPPPNTTILVVRCQCINIGKTLILACCVFKTLINILIVFIFNIVAIGRYNLHVHKSLWSKQLLTLWRENLRSSGWIIYTLSWQLLPSPLRKRWFWNLIVREGMFAIFTKKCFPVF